VLGDVGHPQPVGTVGAEASAHVARAVEQAIARDPTTASRMPASYTPRLVVDRKDLASGRGPITTPDTSRAGRACRVAVGARTRCALSKARAPTKSRSQPGTRTAVDGTRMGVGRRAAAAGHKPPGARLRELTNVAGNYS
jgi:hypothetical protein